MAVNEIERGQSDILRAGGAVRVVHFTSVHSAADVRILRECTTLVRNGYDVTIVGIYPHDATIDGVKISAIPKPSGRLERAISTVARVFRKASSLDADIYHFHDPELLLAGLALMAFGKRVIYDAHEDLPKQVLDKAWLPKALRPAVSAAANSFLRSSATVFSGIVAAWPNIREHFPQGRTALVQNFAQSDEFEIDRAEFVPFRERGNVVLYCGGLMQSRGVREMLDAVARPEMPAGTILKLAGKFADPKTEAQIRDAEQSGSAQFVGFADRGMYRKLLGEAKVGLSVAHPTPAYRETLSSKVFEYMAAGLPVIVSDFPRWREPIDQYKCGIAVNPLDTAEIARAIGELLRDPERAQAMGERGRMAVQERYNWDTEARSLLALYASIQPRGVR